jgi:hypothetical protein
MRRKINLGVALLPVFESREPDRESELSKSHHRRVLGNLIYNKSELMDEHIKERIYDHVLVTSPTIQIVVQTKDQDFQRPWTRTSIPGLEEPRARSYIATRVHHAAEDYNSAGLRSMFNTEYITDWSSTTAPTLHTETGEQSCK